MKSDKLIQLCFAILKEFDKKCTPEQQQVLEALKDHLRKLKNPHFRCWSCTQEHSELNGLSLDDSKEFHICTSCWNKIPPYWRLMAKKWFMDNPSPRDATIEGMVSQMLRPREN